MLPPVTGPNGSDVTFSNLPAHQLAGAQVAAVDKAIAIGANSSPANLFARANLASLSSELQFAQNITVLADAIGKLLNMPKQDGEPASSYVNRLVTTISNLTAPQRSALEATLAKILPGLTLSILTETLRNPTGPQAARLALLMETAPHGSSDLAAKAVVSSYRQNIGAETRPNTAPSQLGQTQSTPQQKAAGNSGAPRISLTAQGDVASVRVPLQQPPNQTAGTASTALPKGNSPLPDIGPRPSVPIPAPTALSATKPPQTAPDTSLSASHRVDVTRVAMDKSPMAQAAQAANVTAKDSGGAANAILPATAAPSRGLSALHHLPITNERLLDQSVKFEPSNRAMRPHASDVRHMIRDYVVTGREVSTPAMNPVAALIMAITTAKLPNSADSSQSLFASLFGMMKASVKDLSLKSSSISTSPNTDLDDMIEELRALPKTDIQQKLVEAIKHLSPGHPQVQALLMATLRSEHSLGLPYVNYPSGDDDYESESYPRGQWSSGQEDQQTDDDQEADEHSEQEPDLNLNVEADETLPMPDEEADQQAESYYLKMSNFS